MKSLVIGASGQVGEHFLEAAGPETTGTYLRHARPGLIPLNIEDLRQFHDVVAQTKPDVIYLMACQANVDYCETHPEVAWQTNVRGARNAVELANEFCCKLVFFSSEYIFDGAAGPYAEDAPVNPICEYGRQKAAAEQFITAGAKDWLIIRTAGVYSWESQGKNFIYRLLGALRGNTTIEVPSDQFSTPTYAPDLVRAVMQLVELDMRGVFNVAGSRVANRYEFAVAAARHFGLSSRFIAPVTTSKLSQAARRPLNAGLIVEKSERALSRPLLDFETGLREMACVS